MATNSGEYIQPCLIRDDDEFELIPVKHTSIRSDWRNVVVRGAPVAPALVAAAPVAEPVAQVGVRVFAGRHDIPLSTSPPLAGIAVGNTIRSFPSAFQSYKPVGGIGGTAATATQSPFQQTKKHPPSKESSEAPGTLIQAVRNVFYNSAKMAESIEAPFLTPLKIPGAETTEEEVYYAYSQCTPPAVEPPPPGFVPRTPDYISE